MIVQNLAVPKGQ